MVGIFTKAGDQPNIIPAEAALKFYMRTPSSNELSDLKAKLMCCFEGAAASTGCKVPEILLI